MSRGEAGASPADAPEAVGVDIGGTKTTVALTRGPAVLAETSFATPQSGLDRLVDEVGSSIDELLQGRPACPVGVCAPGLLETPSGVVRYATNVRGLSGSRLADYVAARLEVPVHVENDATAAAYAEYRFGSGRGLRSIFYLTVSTGIGGGFVDERGAFRGSHGFAADVGHMTLDPDGPVCSCGERGCLEAFASGTAIAREGRRAFGPGVSSHEVFARARAGEPAAVGIVEAASEKIAHGLANVAKVLDPDGIVLGGGVANEGAFLVQAVQSHLDRYLRKYRHVPVRQAELGRLAGVIGAASMAVEGEGLVLG